MARAVTRFEQNTLLYAAAAGYDDGCAKAQQMQLCGGGAPCRAHVRSVWKCPVQ